MSVLELTNFVQFQYEFEPGDVGLLSVFFEGALVFMAEEPESAGVVDSGRVWLGNDFDPGIYSLKFVLESTSGRRLDCSVLDNQFGRISVVPEPTTLVLAAIGLLAMCSGRGRRR